MTAPLYKAYVFRDKDPVIDELRTLIEDHYGKRVSYTELRKIHASGGPTITAMGAWFFGATLRPQSATVEAAGRAIGYKRGWIKLNGSKGRK